VLKRSLERLAGLGYEALSAFEFEVRVFAGSFGTPAAPGPSYGVAALAPLEEFVDEVRHACEGLGLGLAAVHTEGAPGLLELNLEPRLGILAADEAVLLRLVLKEIGRRRDLSVSFMAKPVAGEEGSSGHLHCSLWHRDGRSAFAGSAEPGAPTPLLRQSIAGIVRHLPAMSLLYNPNLNSYKRLLPGFFAPVSACWGFDNRSAAVRVIRPAQADGTHIELRTPGADVNPYLALAGLVGSICVGIESDLVPPSPIGHVDASTASGELAAPLPSSLEAAIGAFKADAGARHALGEEFSNYYLVTRDWELRAWQRIVTDWERQRYAFTT
jgi:glutamine synthetase